MRAISGLVVLSILASGAQASSSIYGSAFDYKKAKPTNVYFSGKSREQIALYCKKEILGTMDLSVCAQFRYELSVEALNRRVTEVYKILEEDDKDNGVYGEPAALPLFKKAQANWKLYRDNDCYSNVYSVGQASLHFVYFWDCMTRKTNNRLNELTKPDPDD